MRGLRTRSGLAPSQIPLKGFPSRANSPSPLHRRHGGESRPHASNGYLQTNRIDAMDRLLVREPFVLKLVNEPFSGECGVLEVALSFFHRILLASRTPRPLSRLRQPIPSGSPSRAARTPRPAYRLNPIAHPAHPATPIRSCALPLEHRHKTAMASTHEIHFPELCSDSVWKRC